ncbi:hypothetical protein PGN35_026130 [Nodosilinea sp. PGN35]|uniref:hypothetical protein n=1 Tax=Nodosilinea sp. PGN35 TaxID=3020489 RepID=UPI0023B2A713|nr:hypothetical protein [Nodosilinea sp. TSF1-S3]MDF0367282.1 hypothetical protein [Nodosilinea sp. TSF1-S3]
MATDQSREAAREADRPAEEVADNPGARTVALHQNPEISKEEARNASEGKGPNAAGGGFPSTVEDHVPSSSDPEATDLPTANSPHTD